MAKKNYAKIFDDLLRYTGYTDASQIKTKTDLFDFFDQVQQDANSKGRGFRVGDLYRKVYEEKFNGSLPGSRDAAERNRIISSGRCFKDYKEASRAGYSFNVGSRRVFKSFIVKNQKRQVRWRDNKGRFFKAPKE